MSGTGIAVAIASILAVTALALAVLNFRVVWRHASGPGKGYVGIGLLAGLQFGVFVFLALSVAATVIA